RLPATGRRGGRSPTVRRVRPRRWPGRGGGGGRSSRSGGAAGGRGGRRAGGVRRSTGCCASVPSSGHRLPVGFGGVAVGGQQLGVGPAEDRARRRRVDHGVGGGEEGRGAGEDDRGSALPAATQLGEAFEIGREHV